MRSRWISALERLEVLERLERLEALETLEALEALETLEALERLESLERLEPLETLERLEALERLEPLERLERLEALERLDSLVRLDSLESLKRLASLAVNIEGVSFIVIQGFKVEKINHFSSIASLYGIRKTRSANVQKEQHCAEHTEQQAQHKLPKIKTKFHKVPSKRRCFLG